MNQLHKIDNINNDFLQRCFFFSQLWIYKCDWWKEAMKEVLLSVLMIFWGCCSVWTVGLDLKIMSVTTFIINETSLFFGLRSSYDYRDKF